jgi:Peptidase family M28/Peptidase family M1 domain
MIRIVLSCCLLLGALVSGAFAVERHEMVVSLDPESHRIEVRDRMEVRGSSLVFRLASGLDLEVGECRVDGEKAEFVRGVDRGRDLLAYAFPLGSDGPHVVEVSYSGTIHDPVKKATDMAFVVGDHTTGLIDEAGVFLSESSLWYPVVEGAMPRFDLEVRIPDPYRVISQGKLVSEDVVDGVAVSKWQSTMPTDSLYLQAGKFHIVRRQHGDVTLGIALLKPNPAVEKLFLDDLEYYLDLYEPLLGPFPHPRFDVVENFFSSGYGMPGYTLLGGDVIRVAVMLARGGHVRAGFLDHELMHCWWGNGVFLDYEKGNWCEGLTSYCTNYYRKEVEDPAAAIEHRKRICQAYSIKVKPENDYPVRAFKGKTEDVDNDIGYGKCSMIFHMVRRNIGDEAFWGALRDVATRFRGKKADWADFEAAFAKASKQDLGAFFSQWLDRTGGPILDLSMTARAYEPPKWAISQSGKPWSLTVPVSILFVSPPIHDPGPHIQQTLIEGSRTSVFVDPRSGAKSVELDPNWDVFRLFTPETIPACLRATTEDPDKIVIHADGVEAYVASAKRAVGDKGGTIRAASEVKPEDLTGHSLFLLGAPWENPVVAKMLAAWGGPVEIGREAVTLKGKKHEGKALSLLLSFRHPENPDRFVTIYFDVDRTALRRPPRFFHYGWDGYVLYDGGRSVARGSSARLHAPPVSTDSIVPEAPHKYEIPEGQGAIPLLMALLDPGLEGRGEGQRGARMAESIVALEMYRAGLAVTRAPFSFEVLDFVGGDMMVGNRLLKGVFVPHPASKETEGEVTRRMGEVKLVAWPADDDRRKWRPYTYASRLPPTGAAKPGNPANPWRRASGAQASIEAGSKELTLAVSPRVLQMLRPDDSLTFSVKFLRRTYRSANVVGVLEGTDPTAPAILVGAHYDGLGKEGKNVFVSADDNASGVTAMLLAAKMLAKGPRLKRTIAFVAFGAEEWGLRGSRAFVKDGSLGNRKIAAMINLDTVGNKDTQDVYVIGRSHHAALAGKTMEILKAAGFGIGKDIDRFAFPEGSDHWPFHEAGIPAIDLWSSNYRIMNTAADTPEKVHPPKIERIALALVNLLTTL